ncbi:MAG: HAMP domain-containing protein [Elusimicrobia bacterium]|nr:HAMP domain-containing protein [Elusimicrobiota bacterium]
MTEAPKKRGRLFYKFLLIFLIVSLVPLGIVGYYLVNLSQITLNRAISRDQEALAVGFADTVSSYIINFRNVLFDAAHLEDFASMNTPKQQGLVSHIMQLHAAFLEISVINADGQETVRLGRFVHETRMRDMANDALFMKVMRAGEFIGGLEKYMGSYPAVTMGVQIVNPVTNQPVGAVLAKMSLTALSSLLKTGFPETTHTQAAVIDSSGFLIAHSNSKEIYKPDAKLPDDVLKILLQNDAKTGSGEMILESTGERVLSAFAEVTELGWVVYIQRSVSVAYQASDDMLKRTWRMMMIVTVFVLFLGYAVSLVITQPIQALREAAIKLGEGDFDYLPDLSMPNDEIGELAHTFMQMSESLKVKTVEIMSAKTELERLNRSLENRVEARTRELKSAQDELIKKERLAAIGQMSSVVGHEIRNPLAVINNSIYFIKTKTNAQPNPEPKVLKHISIIESEIRQANGIIDEILGYARTRELNPKVMHINAYLEDLTMSFPVPAHVEMIKNFAPENPAVSIDPDEMAQAVRNLIKNGIEVMPEHGKLYVRSEVAEGNMVRIDVEDTGCGMPKETAEKIFAPFFTTKARGTGLGLAVVKKVADRHKGRVEVTSVVGKGTCFKLFIPILQNPPPAPGGRS